MNTVANDFDHLVGSLQNPLVSGIMRITQGNPGAITAVTEVIKAAGLNRGSEVVKMFDDIKMYGPNIWLGYKDICGEDPVKLLSKLENDEIASDVEALHYSDYKRGNA